MKFDKFLGQIRDADMPVIPPMPEVFYGGRKTYIVENEIEFYNVCDEINSNTVNNPSLRTIYHIYISKDIVFSKLSNNSYNIYNVESKNKIIFEGVNKEITIKTNRNIINPLGQTLIIKNLTFDVESKDIPISTNLQNCIIENVHFKNVAKETDGYDSYVFLLEIKMLNQVKENPTIELRKISLSTSDSNANLIGNIQPLNLFVYSAGDIRIDLKLYDFYSQFGNKKGNNLLISKFYAIDSLSVFVDGDGSWQFHELQQRDGAFANSNFNQAIILDEIYYNNNTEVTENTADQRYLIIDGESNLVKKLVPQSNL